MGMVAFGAFQAHQFYLNQKDIDCKMEEIKQRSKQMEAASEKPSVDAPSPIGAEAQSPESPSKKKPSINVGNLEPKSPSKDESTEESSDRRKQKQ